MFKSDSVAMVNKGLSDKYRSAGIYLCDNIAKEVKTYISNYQKHDQDDIDTFKVRISLNYFQLLASCGYAVFFISNRFRRKRTDFQKAKKILLQLDVIFIPLLNLTLFFLVNKKTVREEHVLTFFSGQNMKEGSKSV